jgi:hypothetical protein
MRLLRCRVGDDAHHIGVETNDTAAQEDGGPAAMRVVVAEDDVLLSEKV